jgi:CheY-like chemotaxis protein
MKLFVDDVRVPPDSTWEVVRTAQEAIDLLKDGNVDVLSLDHDLGEDLTGYDVIKWIEEQVYTKDFKSPEEIFVHSANPVGAKNIQQAIESIKRYNKLV